MLRYTGIFALSMALYVMPVSGVGPVVCKSREKKWSTDRTSSRAAKPPLRPKTSAEDTLKSKGKYKAK